MSSVDYRGIFSTEEIRTTEGQYGSDDNPFSTKNAAEIQLKKWLVELKLNANKVREGYVWGQVWCYNYWYSYTTYKYWVVADNKEIFKLVDVLSKFKSKGNADGDFLATNHDYIITNWELSKLKDLGTIHISNVHIDKLKECRKLFNKIDTESNGLIDIDSRRSSRSAMHGIEFYTFVYYTFVEQCDKIKEEIKICNEQIQKLERMRIAIKGNCARAFVSD